MTALKRIMWGVLLVAVSVPLIAALFSPLLAYRSPVYVLGSSAGVAALSLMVAQPLLAAGFLSGLPVQTLRRLHRVIGGGLLILVIVHVVGLWITSPPDMIDALLFRSPTPFSLWGVVAMWALVASAFLALFRKRLGFRPQTWRMIHTGLALAIVGGSVAHAVLIEGTMEYWSKWGLGIALIAATLAAVVVRRVWSKGAKRR